MKREQPANRRGGKTVKFRRRAASAPKPLWAFGGSLLALAALAERAAAQPPALTTLYAFTGGADGGAPRAGVAIGANAVLYGTTYLGGSGTGDCAPSYCGTVFSLTPPASPGGPWTETVLHSFQGGFDGNSDGNNPMAGVVIGNEGALYGTTLYGGAESGHGTVFQLVPPASQGAAWAYSILHTFQAGGTSADGALPEASMVFGLDGALYGTTTEGGGACGGFGCGTVFEVAPPTASDGAWTETVIYNFTIPRPNSGLVHSQTGALCGVTGSPTGRRSGYAFGLSPPAQPGGAWRHSVLADLGHSLPDSVIVGPEGVLYGLTYGGGLSGPICGQDGCGTVFQLTPPAAAGARWAEVVLYEFTGQNGDGALPRGLLLGPGGVLYGATAEGGDSACPAGCGTLFELSPPAAPAGPWTETVLYSFTAGADGSDPNGGLAIDGNGTIYGTTGGSGALGAGTVFQFTP